jgi:hypothetical protein
MGRLAAADVAVAMHWSPQGVEKIAREKQANV